MPEGFLQGIWQNIPTLWAILVLAALAGLYSERSGIVNIGLEGIMLMAAFMTAFAGAHSGSPLVGILAALLTGVVMALIHYLLTQTYHVDHIVSGMVVNLLGIGGTNFLDKKLGVPGSPGLFPTWVYALLAICAATTTAIALKRSRGGLRLLAVGNDPDKAREAGIKPLQVRFSSLCVTGILCGLSGALVLTNSGTFSDNMTAGRGFIALAALIVGGWRPWSTLAACAFFALMEAVQIQLQGSPVFGIEVPQAVWNSTPYLITLLALGGLIGKVKPPAGLGQA